MDRKVFVDRFLAWKLPATVCSDLCVTMKDYKFPRSGTSLISADEAGQLFDYLFAFSPAEAFDKFGHHLSDCAYDYPRNYPCTCGFDAARLALRARAGEEK